MIPTLYSFFLFLFFFSFFFFPSFFLPFLLPSSFLFTSFAFPPSSFAFPLPSSPPFIIPLFVFIYQSAFFFLLQTCSSRLLLFSIFPALRIPLAPLSTPSPIPSPLFPPSSIPLLLLLFPSSSLSSFYSFLSPSTLSPLFIAWQKKKKIYQNMRKRESKTKIPLILF